MVLATILILGLAFLVVGCYGGLSSGTTLASATITAAGNVNSSTTSSSSSSNTSATSTVASSAIKKFIYAPSTAYGNMGDSNSEEMANDANAAIYSSFARNENGSFIYPNDFGGTYIDSGKLILCITQEGNQDNYQSLLNASQRSLVNFKVVKHNFNHLMQLAKELAVKEDGYTTYGVDVMNNRAEVCLPDEAKVNSNNPSNSKSDIPVIYKYQQKVTISG